MPDAAPYRYAKQLAIRPVDAAQDAEILIAFGRDLYIESLGADAYFYRDYGVQGEKFPHWVVSCGKTNPNFAALLTEDQRRVGLVVLGIDRRDSHIGHVHHFYIVPSHRGQGFGGVLDDYARMTLLKAGFERARLNVAARNVRAIRFYLAQGWTELPPRNASVLRYMEVDL